MSVYVIAQLAIHDRDRYNQYQSRFLEVFRRFKGELLAGDESPEIVEGAWDKEKVVLLKFPDKKSFEDWAYSDEYRKIAEDRKAGSEAVILLVKGF